MAAMTIKKPKELILIRPLFPVAVAFIGGLSLGAWAPGHLGPAIVVILGLGAGLGWLVVCQRQALWLPILLCLALGYAAIQPWLKSDLPAEHVSRFVDQGKWQVRGKVIDQPRCRQGRCYFTLEVVALVQGQQRHLVSGRVKVTVRGTEQEVRRGDLVMLSGHLRAIRNFSNPGGFDYERFMALKGIRTRLYTQSKKLQIVSTKTDLAERRPLRSWTEGIDDVRQSIVMKMDLAVKGHGPEVTSVLKALIVGDRSHISADMRQAFNRSGVGHVLAISGLHIGIVAGFGFAIFVKLLSWIPALLWRGWVRRAAAILSLVPILGYGLLSGWSPSTQRAVIMVSVVLLSCWIGRRHDWLNALAVAALIILVLYPPALLSISFQLSFAAVLAILLGMRWLPWQPDTFPKTLRLRLGYRVATLFWVSLLATFGTLPLVMRYFNQVSWIGPITNLGVVPLVGMVVVPAGLLGTVCSAFSMLLAEICWQVAALGLQAVFWVINLVSHISFAAAKTVTPSLFEIVLFYLLLSALAMWKHHSFRIAVMIMLLVAGGLDGAYWLYQRYGRQDMRVTALDVGQGSANLLQLPGGYTVLIDGGGFSDNQVFDVGERIIAPVLWHNKIKTVDLVILTHAHSDHLNGLLYILQHFKVGEIWSTHEPGRTRGYGQWRQTIKAKQIRHTPFNQLNAREIRAGVLFEVLAPPKGFRHTNPRMRWRNLNNNSMVVRINLKRVSFLFTGDLMADAEVDLLARLSPERLRSTILIIPHHGGSKSSTSPFLLTVQPAEAIISAGWRNRFGFPHSEVLKRLEAIPCRIWRTDIFGAIQFKTDGVRYQVRTARKE